jgi:hypothetical protein
MEREKRLMHDDGSCTMEGEGVAQEYLQHDFDHKKGKGDSEEHLGAFGHDEMHSIPHNSAPFSSYVETVLPGVHDAIKTAKHGPKSHGGGSLKSLTDKPDVM